MVEQIQKACGQTLINMMNISGGDVSMAYKGTLSDGSHIFIKCHDQSLLLTTEAQGLKWLKNTHTIFTPEIICVSSEEEEKGFLVLEWIEPGNAALPDWENLGYALASLHRISSIQYGWHQNNYLGNILQKNRHESDWGTFFSKHRITPLLSICSEKSLLSTQLITRLYTLSHRLPELLATQESPCAVHGDLWNGNQLFTKYGEPYFFDPAPYWGHREVDLAMMELFGGFHPRAFAAYIDSYPLEQGWEERRSVLQLYYLLAHVILHGESWSTSVEATLLELGF